MDATELEENQSGIWTKWNDDVADSHSNNNNRKKKFARYELVHSQ